MTDPVKAVGIATGILAALGIRFERNDDGTYRRVTIAGLPVFDENFRGVKRRRARREARRAARRRDAR